MIIVISWEKRQRLKSMHIKLTMQSQNQTVYQK